MSPGALLGTVGSLSSIPGFGLQWFQQTAMVASAASWIHPALTITQQTSASCLVALHMPALAVSVQKMCSKEQKSMAADPLLVQLGINHELIPFHGK